MYRYTPTDLQLGADPSSKTVAFVLEPLGDLCSNVNGCRGLHCKVCQGRCVNNIEYHRPDGLCEAAEAGGGRLIETTDDNEDVDEEEVVAIEHEEVAVVKDCLKDCSNEDISPLCGSDGTTYNSLCHLENAICKDDKIFKVRAERSALVCFFDSPVLCRTIFVYTVGHMF